MTPRSRYAVLGSLVLVALVALAVAVLAGVVLGGASPTWQFGPFAGYVWRGHVASVQGSWTVPRILRGSPLGHAGTWIGAQAPGTRGPFIQIGTNEDHFSATDSSYYAFWSDTARNFTAQFLFSVKPGDDLSASLTLVHKRWTLAIVDATSGASAHFSTSDETHASFNLAEWMQEDVTNQTTHKLYPYPRLMAVSFHRLTVNSSAPTYAEVYSQWMSANGSSLAPSPLSDDSFTLRQATVSAAGGQYLHIATPEDVATETFVTGFTRWTAKTPYSQMESASSRFVAVLRRNARAFASKRWPTQIRGLIHSLIGDIQVVLEDSRPPALVSSAELAAWRSKWMRDAEVLSNTARMIKRILSLPEIRPVT